MLDGDRPVEHVDGAAALPGEDVEELGGEAAAGELEVLVLLGVDEPTRPVVAEDEPVPVEDLVPGDLLGHTEPVLDDLEDDVEPGEGEDDHDEAPGPGGDLEPVGRRGEVAAELPVELRLAVLVVPERHVELRPALAGKEGGEEVDERVGAPHVDVEVRTGEAEEDARLVLREEDGVDDDPRRGTEEGDDEGHRLPAGVDAPDEVRPLPPEEDGVDDLHPVDPGRRPDAGEAGVDPGRDGGGVPGQVDEGGLEAGPDEDLADEGGRVPRPPVGPHDRFRRPRGGVVEVGVDELDVRVDPDRREDLPGDGVEERLRHVPVRPLLDESRVDGLHRRPHRPVLDPVAEDPGDGAGGLPGDGAVEVETLDVVRRHPLPVAGVETETGPAGDDPEPVGEARPGVADRPRPEVGAPAVGEVDGHGAPLWPTRRAGASRPARRGGRQTSVETSRKHDGSNVATTR